MRALLIISTLLGLISLSANAQTPLAVPFTDIETLSTTSVPIASPSFPVATAGTYSLTFNDLGAQLTPAAPLAAVQVALTQGTTVVAQLTAAGSTQVQLAAGTYVIRVSGTPGSQPGSGIFSASVTASGSTTATYAFSGTLSAPPTAVPNHVSVYQGSITLGASGSYTAEMVDLAFPQALSTVSFLITSPGAAVPAAVLNASGSAAFTGTGTYSLFALGDSPVATNAGAFVIRIRDANNADPTSNILFSQVVTVGQVTSLGATASLAAGQYTVSATDLQFPAALTTGGVLLTSQGNVSVVQVTPGTANLAVTTPGPYQVFAYASPAAAPAAGTLGVQITDASSNIAFAGVSPAGGTAGTATPVYVFPGTVASAGSYTATVSDLKFTAPLSTLRYAVTQGSSLIGGPSAAAGSTSVSLKSGAVFVLAYALPAAQSGTLQQTGGLLSAQLLPATGSALIQGTQGVGGAFTTRTFSIATAGDYRISLADIGFPSSFTQLAAAVSQGSTLLGQIYGTGSFDITGAQPGTYIINVLATPNATLNAGSFAISAAVKPAPPTVTISASPTAPSIGGSVTLTWSATNANSCTASSAWSGTQPTSGSLSIPSVNATSTYTLSCTGDGGTTAQSVTVTPAASTSGHGGGGALDLGLLLALLGLVGLRLRLGAPGTTAS